MKSLWRIGPRPILLTRYVWHHVVRRWDRWRLARRYDALVTVAPSSASLRPTAVFLASAAELPDALRPEAESLRAEAEEILEHRVDYLGSGPTYLGQTIDWHTDFKSGYRWPAAFYQSIQVTRLDDRSDAKVPWELSRGHQLLTLARAAVIFQDERYADELEAQLESWLLANPPGIGINWVNAMEVAIRSVNWIWAIGTLETLRPLDPALRPRVTESLQAHARHIFQNLESTPYLRSNHYLADILGLLTLGASLYGDPDASNWFEYARREFEREVRSQVLDDGVGFEASLPYHGLSLEMFLIAAVVAENGGRPLSAAYRERVLKMAAVSAAVRHPGGRIPQFGDGDSGRILPGGFARPATHDAVISLASAVLGAPRIDDVHPEVAWTLGVERWMSLAATSPASLPRSDLTLPAGGLHVLRSADAHLVVRTGDVGQNGNGGHAHNDLLSFELSLDGCVLVVDSGTYAYTFDPSARNVFRGSAAHNSIRIDCEELNPIDEGVMFRLRQVARARTERPAGRGGPLIVAHDGYRSRGVDHRRTFVLEEERLTVDDEICGSGEHVIEGFVHFAPGIGARRRPDGVVEARVDDRIHLLHWTGFDEVAVEAGWVSNSYGTRESAWVVRATARRTCPAQFSLVLEASQGRLSASTPVSVGAAK